MGHIRMLRTAFALRKNYRVYPDIIFSNQTIQIANRYTSSERLAEIKYKRILLKSKTYLSLEIRKEQNL